ncbi:MAG: hypothetical protein JW869_01165 [Candidatus Omnitrophica bacterium]|nr:hypothetical protein [Candidatus Omnitrophota bacterium]
MTKKKIDVQKEVSKIWEQTKERLKELGQSTMIMAQKGEKEVVRASKVGKYQLDIVSLNLKKENIYRQVGKKVCEAHARKGDIQSVKLASLFNQVDKINNQIRSDKSKIAKLKKS